MTLSQEMVLRTIAGTLRVASTHDTERVRPSQVTKLILHRISAPAHQKNPVKVSSGL